MEQTWLSYIVHRKILCYKAMSFVAVTAGEHRQQKLRHVGNRAFPKGWVISEHGKLQFSKSASPVVFLALSPEPRQKDTLQLAENRPNVQVWSWDEPVQITVQDYNKEKELKRSYQAVYHINGGRICQLGRWELSQILLGDEGDAPLALLSTWRPYSLSSMWEGRSTQ